MLDRLETNSGSHMRKKRKGRGSGSGKGHTCGRGQKGAGARSGHKKRAWFEGGQMPLARRLPKRGFTNVFREERQVVNVAALACFDAGATVDGTALHGAGLIARADRPVKVLAGGEVGHAITLRVAAISASARRKVEAAGGQVEIADSSRTREKSS